MFQVGQRVMYGAHGVCTIAASESRRVDRKDMTYLVLEPMDQSGAKYYVPVQNPAAMGKLRPMLTGAELTELMYSAAVHTDAWVKDENQRKQCYRNLIGGGDRVSVMQMVYTIYQHRQAQRAAGKKCHLCDENFLRDAEKLLIGEISATLNLDQEQSRNFLHEKLHDNV